MLAIPELLRQCLLSFLYFLFLPDQYNSFFPPAPSLYHGHHEKSPLLLFYTSPLSLKKSLSNLLFLSSLASHYQLCCSPISKQGSSTTSMVAPTSCRVHASNAAPSWQKRGPLLASKKITRVVPQTNWKNP